jgi:farnesyl-diphosphate farnesyltransferase
MTIDDSADREFCFAMLPKVSRTFALGIRLLPPGLGYSVLVAYLLCRIADTIEDTADLAPDARRNLFSPFSSCLETGGPAPDPLQETFHRRRTDEERLAADAERVLRAFRTLPTATQAAIRPWVQEMASGMAEFAVQPTESREGGLKTLASVAELDRYCYFVAGTVGHLLTALFQLHHRAIGGKRLQRLDKLATNFGLGLQLTNIIKDVADDRRRGWSFVPRDLCELSGIQPEQLPDPAHAAQADQVMKTLITKARRHLDDALTYCETLPSSAYRVRVFCLVSLYFAIRTLRLAERDPHLLDPSHKVKITRGDVYRTVAATYTVAPFNALIRAYYGRLAAS